MGASTSTRDSSIVQNIQSSNEPLVLALNAGSSSLKASLLQGNKSVVSFLAERVSTDDSVVHVVKDGNKDELAKEANMDHAKALNFILDFLKEHDVMDKLSAVGHRVVHGGTAFTDSAIIDDEAYEKLQAVTRLAPLHNPHNIAGIDTMRQSDHKDIPNVAVFDTTFHSTLPTKAYTYPLPENYRDLGMRKYGFHGTSVHFVAQEATQVLRKLRGDGKDDQNFNMIVCHLGSGASVTAVSDMRSVETSMGFTPLAGLMMGSRCGDIDPSVVQHVCHELDMSVDDVLKDLNKKSGLKGMISDGETDMREIVQRMKASGGDESKGVTKDQHEEAKLAVEMFVYRLAKHVASSLVALDGPLDAIVFTAGIGEHSAEIRSMTMQQLRHVLPSKISLDDERNLADGEDSDGVLSEEGQWPVVLDIATDEEVMIAKECLRLVK